MPSKYSFGFVKSYIEEHEYELLSEEENYKNTNTEIVVICPWGHQYKTRFVYFKYGKRCKQCSIERIHQNQRYSYEFVKSYIEEHGYKLLSEDYVKNSEKLEMRCDKGHYCNISFSNFKRGCRCYLCSREKLGKYKKLNLDIVKSYIEEHGYKLLSKKYKNSWTKLKIKCPYGHIFWMSYNSFQSGHLCPLCMSKERGKRQTLPYSYVKSFIGDNGYELLSRDYKNAHEKLNIKCPHGHIFWMSYNSFQSGYRCLECSKGKQNSKQEKEIQNFIKKITEKEVICNDKTTIFNQNTGYYLELDVFIPELKKAIEFNGEYWHNRPKSIGRDKVKVKVCKEKSIDLMVVYYKDWIDNKGKIFYDIEKFIGEGNLWA